MNDIDCIKPSKVETINKPWIYNLDDKDRILAYTSYKIDNPSKWGKWDEKDMYWRVSIRRRIWNILNILRMVKLFMKGNVAAALLQAQAY